MTLWRWQSQNVEGLPPPFCWVTVVLVTVMVALHVNAMRLALAGLFWGQKGGKDGSAAMGRTDLQMSRRTGVRALRTGKGVRGR